MRKYKNITKKSIIFIGIMVAIHLAPLRVELVHAEGYTLGVVPYLPPGRLEERFGPYAAVIARALDRQVTFRTKTTYEIFKNEIVNQTYDIVFLQPFDYPEATDKHEYLPLARANEPLTALIVTRKVSALKTLSDLKHKTLATPPMASAVGRLGLDAMRKIGLSANSDFKLRLSTTHSACMQAVLIDKADACITNNVPLRVHRSTKRDLFKILAETESIPHALFMAHKRIPLRERELIRSALLKLNNSPAGKNLLIHSGWKNGFVKARDADYAAIRYMPPIPTKP
ncbi:MAG: phosphate/phosphite/phosphonate ABC transporter substrate-binding protein [Rhodospirillaceae bacterium]|nr:phosphate/phosphite/phosphonate ABC transporter substrate-binding protein [Rhodospirillaceae bacterium]